MAFQELRMNTGADVLPFRRPDDSLERRGIAIFSPGSGSRSTHLRTLYRAATGETELDQNPDRQLELTFGVPRAARIVALNGRMAQPPLGLALAVPVVTLQELADALAVNFFDAHVRDTLGQKRSWALLVAVHDPLRRTGIGRALANRALDAIRDAGGERVYLAAPNRAAWTTPWLLDRAFSRDGITREIHPRTLFSRAVNFAF